MDYLVEYISKQPYVPNPAGGIRIAVLNSAHATVLRPNRVARSGGHRSAEFDTTHDIKLARRGPTLLRVSAPVEQNEAIKFVPLYTTGNPIFGICVGRQIIRVVCPYACVEGVHKHDAGLTQCRRADVRRSWRVIVCFVILRKFQAETTLSIFECIWYPGAWPRS